MPVVERVQEYADRASSVSVTRRSSLEFVTVKVIIANVVLTVTLCDALIVIEK